MQEDSQSKYDQLIQKRIKVEGLEKPSLNFTNAVITKIEAQKASNMVINEQPLLPKYFWYSGAAIVLAIFSYLIYGNVDLGFNWIPEEKISQIEQISLFERLPDINISNIYVYAFIGLAFFVGLQIVLLKNHFNKRYYLD